MRRESVPGPEAIHAARAFALGFAVAVAVPGTLVAMRLQRSGVIAGLAYLVVGLAWIWSTQPPLYLRAWLVVAAGAGASTESAADKVSRWRGCARRASR